MNGWEDVVKTVDIHFNLYERESEKKLLPVLCRIIIKRIKKRQWKNNEAMTEKESGSGKKMKSKLLQYTHGSIPYKQMRKSIWRNFSLKAKSKKIIKIYIQRYIMYKYELYVYFIYKGARKRKRGIQSKRTSGPWIRNII